MAKEVTRDTCANCGMDKYSNITPFARDGSCLNCGKSFYEVELIPVDQPEPLAHVERMQTEAQELSIRIASLNTFWRSEKFANLTPLQQQLMQAQHGVMLAYLQILSTRINNELDLL